MSDEQAPYGPAAGSGGDRAVAADAGEAGGAARRWRTAADEGAVLLDGFHALKHALRFGADVRLAVCADKAGTLRLADGLAPDLGDRLADLLTQLPQQVLRDLLVRVHPTAVAALARRPDPGAASATLSRRPRQAPVVVLDRPRNLGNVGAVVRLAAGFGVTGVVTTGDLDPWHPNAVRAGAGLHYATHVARTPADALPDGPLFVLDPEGRDIRSTGLPDDALIVFGSERHGVSGELRSRADALIALPMRPRVSSYNLATSVGMALYHWAATSASPLVPALAGS